MSQELRKVRKKSKSGSGTDSLICSNWPYFQAMRFLVPVLTNDNTSSYTETSVSVVSKSHETSPAVVIKKSLNSFLTSF